MVVTPLTFVTALGKESYPMQDQPEDLLAEIDKATSLKNPFGRFITFSVLLSTVVIPIYLFFKNLNIGWYWFVIAFLGIWLVIMVVSYWDLCSLLLKVRKELTNRLHNHRTLARQHEDLVWELENTRIRNEILEQLFIRALVMSPNQEEQMRLQSLLENTRRHLNG